MTIYERLVSALPDGTVTGPDEIEPRYLGDWMNANEDAVPAAEPVMPVDESLDAIATGEVRLRLARFG